MKISSLLIVISLITGNAGRFFEEITITRTTSDKQIEAAESKIQKEYGLKFQYVDIKPFFRPV